jgi:hypothetical protein
MGREVRRVPANWVHPRDAEGDLIPMHEHFPYNASEVQEGLADGWLVNEPPYYGVPVMPQWADEERTHYMMYETTTEGTPLSPAMPTPEALAQWLVDRQTRLCADAAASYPTWLAVIHGRAAVVPGCVLPTAHAGQVP